jgi:hypothetical protein
MKKFVIKALFLAAIILCIDSLFGAAMQQILYHTEKGDWGRNNYITNELKSDIIILGSSRAIHHYDPKIFSDSLGLSCYNCGEDGMGIITMYARYKLICQRQIPKIVIYEFLPGFDYEEEDDSRYLRFLRPLPHNTITDSIIYNVSSLEKFKLISRLYAYNSFFIDIISQRYSKSTSIAKDYTYAALNGEMNYQPNLNNEGIDAPKADSLKLKYMEKLIHDCKENGTQLIFVTSPIYLGLWNTSFDWLNQVCEENNIAYYNHFLDTIYYEKPHLFTDSYHLNKRGAESFSQLLSQEIKSGSKMWRNE